MASTNTRSIMSNTRFDVQSHWSHIVTCARAHFLIRAREYVGTQGYSVRTRQYRYTEWFKWTSTCQAEWDQPSAGVELYSHRGKWDVPLALLPAPLRLRDHHHHTSPLSYLLPCVSAITTITPLRSLVRVFVSLFDPSVCTSGSVSSALRA